MKDPFLVTLGERIRSFRKAGRLSQESLSELADIHPTYLGQIERGEVNPSTKTLFRISHALGISLSELFSFLTMEEPATRKELLLSRLTISLKEKDEDFIEMTNEIIDDLLKWLKK